MTKVEKEQIMMLAYLTLCITYGAIFYTKYQAKNKK